jgi:hypothetical protein
VSEDNLQKALDHFVSSGGLNEDPDMLDVRLHAAFREAAVANRMEPMDMGLGDWSEAKIKAIKIAVHGEICDEKNGKVQEKYLGLRSVCAGG